MFEVIEINEAKNTGTFQYREGDFLRRWFAVPVSSDKVGFVTSFHRESGIPSTFKNKSFKSVAEAADAVLALNNKED